MPDLYFRSGQVIARVHWHADGRTFVDAMDTVTNTVESGAFDITGEMTVRIAKAAVGRVLQRGVARKRVFESHMAWREKGGQRFLILIRVNETGEPLNGLGAWDPVVHKGAAQPAPPDVPASEPDRGYFADGVREAWRDHRVVPFDFYAHPAAFQRGFMLVRRYLTSGLESQAYALVESLRRKTPPRKRRSERKEYAIPYRGPQGSGRGSYKHAGGRRGTLRQVAHWYAEDYDGPYHASAHLWVSADGLRAYSYKQVIAAKAAVGHKVYVTPTEYSPTTNRHVRALLYALEMAGWKIIREDP